MGRAIMIKNADFSDVAVDQVTIEASVPCTGITLSQNTATFTEVGDTVTITATVAPVNTTDEVSWTSSNTNVATVSSSGVITIHGIGTATVTATCGRKTATVSINQASLQFTDIASANDRRANDNTNMLALYSTSNSKCIGKEYTNVDSLRVFGGEEKNLEAIPVPYGATSVTIMASQRIFWSYLYIGDMTDLTTYSGKNYAKYVKDYSTFYTDVSKAVEYGQCIIFSSSEENVALVSGLLFQ